MSARECRSASVVVSQREPSQTPWAPRARPAAICSPLPMPPAARTGSGATASAISGTSTIVAMSPVWPCGLVALGDDDVDAGFGVTTGVFGAAREGGDEDAVVVGAADDVGGRGTERVRQEFDGVVEGDVELVPCHPFHPAGDPPAGCLALRELGHVVLGEGVADEGAVSGGDHRLDVGFGDAVDGLLGGHDDVEAVGLAVGVRLHPVEVAFEVVGGGVADGAEYAESARAGDGSGDRREGREAEDGVLDSQFLAQLRLHGREDAAARRSREGVS